MSAWLNRILRRKPPPVRYRGHLDSLHDFIVAGWAIDFQAPDQAVTVELLVDGLAVAETLADRPRADLKQALIGSGLQGFVISLPDSAFDGRHHTISARIKDSGHPLMGSWEAVLLNPEWKARFDGTVTGVEEGSILRGYCRSLGSDPQPLIIDLLLDGQRIGQATAAGPSPINELADGCGFGFDLLKFWHPAMLSGMLECRIAGTSLSFPASPAVHRAIQLEPLRQRDGALIGSVHLPPFVPVDTVIDISVDGAPAPEVEWTSAPGLYGIVVRQFRIPLPATSATGGQQLEMQLRGLDFRLGRSRQQPPAAQRNLLDNAFFQHWQGRQPEAWQLPPMGLSRCLPEHCLLDLANAELPWFGPLALRLDLLPPGDGNTDNLDEGEPRLSLLTQSLSSQSLPTEGSLEVVLVARAATTRPAEVVLEFETCDGSRCESRAPAQLIERWTQQTLHLALPAAAAAGLASATLRIETSDDIGTVHFAAIGLGRSGFEWNPGTSTVPNDTAEGLPPDPNAVINGRFSGWSRGLEFGKPGRRLETADRWLLRCEATPAALNARLEKLSLPATAANPLPRELYGLGLFGESATTLRLETTLDPLSLRLDTPETLSFYAARRPYHGKQTAAPIERILLIQRSPRPASPNVTAASRDEVLCVIAQRVVPSQSGRYHEFRLPPLKLEGGALSGQAQQPNSGSSLLLLFEFSGEIDCVLADVFLGNQLKRQAADAPSLPGASGTADTKPARREAGYVGLEDSNISNQLDLIKGLAAWGGSAPIALSASNAGPGQADNESGAASDGVHWSLPHLQFPSVEIVIPVYNAPQDVMNCLRSIERNTGVPYLLTLVDDASDAETEQLLRRYVRGRPWVKLIRNDVNLGYTRTSNIGLTQSAAQWVLLLNSDTLVTPGWLEGLIECAQSDPAIKFVGALSNAASWQSVPELFDSRGKFKINILPDGWSANDFATLVRRESRRAFPRVPLLNGFCTMMERDALERLGYLDELAFPVGYGEENDLCLRAGKAGYQLAVADHVYVYHVKSASFGTERRDQLSKQGTEQLRIKHPDVDLKLEQQRLLNLAALAELRSTLNEKLAGRPAPISSGAG